MMEPMFIAHVLPELQSSQPFLRLRACWLYGEFGEFKFKDTNHINQAVDGIYKCLFDTDLPVRLIAATSIHKLINKKQVLTFL